MEKPKSQISPKITIAKYYMLQEESKGLQKIPNYNFKITVSEMSSSCINRQFAQTKICLGAIYICDENMSTGIEVICYAQRQIIDQSTFIYL